MNSVCIDSVTYAIQFYCIWYLLKCWDNLVKIRWSARLHWSLSNANKTICKTEKQWINNALIRWKYSDISYRLHTRCTNSLHMFNGPFWVGFCRSIFCSLFRFLLHTFQLKIIIHYIQVIGWKSIQVIAIHNKRNWCCILIMKCMDPAIECCPPYRYDIPSYAQIKYFVILPLLLH